MDDNASFDMKAKLAQSSLALVKREMFQVSNTVSLSSCLQALIEIAARTSTEHCSTIVADNAFMSRLNLCI